jgi:hypothetical protein
MQRLCFSVRNQAASRAERWRCAPHTCVTRLCQYESPAGERTVLSFAPPVGAAGPATVPRCCHTMRTTRPLRPGVACALALNALR